MAKYSPLDQVWIVKSADLVLGPFNESELSEAIIIGRVSLLDEVKAPRARWKFLREQSEFAEAIKKAREKDDGDIDTVNVAQSPEDLDERTPLLAPSEFMATSANRSNQSQAKNANHSEIQTTNSLINAGEKKPTHKRSPSSDFIRLPPQSQKAKSSHIALWALTITCITLVFGGALYFLNSRNGFRSGASKEINMELVKEGLRLKNIGLYLKSAQLYHQATESRQVPLDLQLEMLPVLAQDAKYADEIIQVGNRVISDTNMSIDIKNRVMNLMGLAYIKKNQLNEAEALYSKIVDISSNRALTINHLLVRYLSHDYNYVLSQASELRKIGHAHPLSLSLEAFAIFESDDDFSKDQFDIITSDIERAIRDFPEYADMLNLAQLSVAVRSKKFSLMTSTIRDLTENLLPEENPFYFDLEFANDLSQWFNLKNNCNKILEKMNEPSYAEVLKATCDSRYKKAEDIEATLSESVSDKRASELMNNIKLALRIRNQNYSEVMEKLATPKSVFHMLLKAKLCLDKKEYACVDEYAEKILSKDSANLDAYWVWAKSLQEQMKRKSALEKVHEGLKVSKRHLPLLLLKESLGG